MKTITSKQGKTYRVDDVIIGIRGRNAQIYPNWGQVNLSPIDKGTTHHGIQLPEYLIEKWLDGKIVVSVNES